MNIMSRIVTAFLISAFFVFSAPFAHAELPTMNPQTVCFTPTRCDKPNSQCSEYGESPLVRVHRVRLEVEGQLRSNEIFMQECIERILDNGETGQTICIPLPIQQEGSNWKVSNKFTNGSKSWDGNESLFTSAKKRECIASFSSAADPTLVEETCERIANGWQDDVDAYLTSNNYAFHGLFAYTGTAPTTLSAENAYTTFPTQYERGRIFEWGSSSTYANHYFIATTYTNPIDGTSGDDPSNKVGQLGFPISTPECASEDYDPFGQVFDRETMQPVEDVHVALFRDVQDPDNPQPANYILFNQYAVDKLIDYGVLGPQYVLPVSYEPALNTNKLGYYSFVVPPGEYKVVVSRTSTNYQPNRQYPIPTLAVTSSVMDISATELGRVARVLVGGMQYDLYPDVYQVKEEPVGQVFLPVIIEGTVPERRDVSIEGVAPQPASVVSYQRDVTSQGNWIVKGRINKPFGSVSAKKREQGNQWSVIQTTSADKDGRFSMTILRQEIPDLAQEWRLFAEANQLISVPQAPPAANAGLIGLLEKVLQIFFPSVHAQSMDQGIIMKPRLAHLDGVAYDATGNPMPNATVTVVNDRVGSVTYVTSTDSQGKYFVPSDKLPLGDYTVYYSIEGSTITVSVDSAKFYEQNKEYLEMQNIDVRQPRYSEQAQAYLTQNPQRPNEPAVTGTQGTSEVQNTPVVQPPQQLPTNQSISPVLLMYVAILLLLVVGAGLLIMFYMKRKHEPHLYE